ncbi:protein phosphatase 1 regulatory subunit 3E-like [Microcaecilia unicolor]|uniref:Protein phosphatase 1 regulatory subunit 3E-like n=1 Tax=Microcaecilia unicolor TaxID=1415580 RepID=A0A6P7Y6Z8_9AMPH|nr:protein phosphatase 1 regulatory subunit 3E-like [Microcaecilia unicolor]
MEKAAVHSAVPVPAPRLYLPRNFSCSAALFGSTPEQPPLCPALPEGPPRHHQQDKEAPSPASAIEKASRGRDPGPSPLSPGSRRRAKSLPSPAQRCCQAQPLQIAQSPTRRKKVRFADSLGLELISVRHFCDAEQPLVPPRVTAALRCRESAPAGSELSVMPGGAALQSILLEPLFATHPGAAPDFVERVKQRRVCLEALRTDGFGLSGLVRVLNLSYEKAVAVRYSLDHWLTCAEAAAYYQPPGSSCSSSAECSATDLFSFRLVAPVLLERGGMLEFAVRYRVAGAEYWDNNNGGNYKVRSHKLRVSPPGDLDSAWIHFI